MSFKVLVWCPDCKNEDPLGCFDGNSEYLYKDGKVELFPTKEQAEAAGIAECKESIWEFEVEVYEAEE